MEETTGREVRTVGPRVGSGGSVISVVPDVWRGLLLRARGPILSLAQTKTPDPTPVKLLKISAN